MCVGRWLIGCLLREATKGPYCTCSLNYHPSPTRFCSFPALVDLKTTTCCVLHRTLHSWLRRLDVPSLTTGWRHGVKSMVLFSAPPYALGSDLLGRTLAPVLGAKPRLYFYLPPLVPLKNFSFPLPCSVTDFPFAWVYSWCALLFLLSNKSCFFLRCFFFSFYFTPDSQHRWSRRHVNPCSARFYNRSRRHADWEGCRSGTLMEQQNHSPRRAMELPRRWLLLVLQIKVKWCKGTGRRLYLKRLVLG